MLNIAHQKQSPFLGWLPVPTTTKKCVTDRINGLALTCVKTHQHKTRACARDDSLKPTYGIIPHVSEILTNPNVKNLSKLDIQKFVEIDNPLDDGFDIDLDFEEEFQARKEICQSIKKGTTANSAALLDCCHSLGLLRSRLFISPFKAVTINCPVVSFSDFNCSTLSAISCGTRASNFLDFALTALVAITHSSDDRWLTVYTKNKLIKGLTWQPPINIVADTKGGFKPLCRTMPRSGGTHARHLTTTLLRIMPWLTTSVPISLRQSTAINKKTSPLCCAFRQSMNHPPARYAPHTIISTLLAAFALRRWCMADFIDKTPLTLDEIAFQNMALAYAAIHINHPTVTEALLFVLLEKLDTTYQMITKEPDHE